MSVLVHFRETRETKTGERVGIEGTLRFKPTRARIIAGTPDEEVLPHPFTAKTDSDGLASVPLAVTGASWAWEVWFSSPHGRWGPVTVAVSGAGEADWPDLVRVDPDTLAPTAEPEAAWWAAWEAAQVATPATRGLIITDANVTTIPAGDAVDNLAAYYNSGASAITVQGTSIAAGAHAVWAWVSGAWTLLFSGTTAPPVDPGDTVVTPTAPTSDDATNTYTIPTTTGVNYKIGGVATPAGSYSVGNVTTSITILAVAQTGYALSGTESWTFNFTVSTSYVAVLFDDFDAPDGTRIDGRATADGLGTWASTAGAPEIISGRVGGPAVQGGVSAKLSRNTVPTDTTPQAIRVSFDYQTTGTTGTVAFPIHTNAYGISEVGVSFTWSGTVLLAQTGSTLSALSGDTSGWPRSGSMVVEIVGTSITITDGTRTAVGTILAGRLTDPAHLRVSLSTNYVSSQKAYVDNVKLEVMA